MSIFICQFCGRETTNPGANKKHENSCINNPNPIKYSGGRKKGTTAWNKGLTKDIDKRVLKNSISVSNALKEKVKNETFVPPKMSEKAKRTQSLRMSQQNPGGKSKWYEVDGKKVQGSWEYNIALSLNSMNILWERCNPIEYFIENQFKHYTPDFYLPEFDVYLEVKGYWWGNDKDKMQKVIKQHPDKKIIIVEKDQYKKILDGELVW